MECGVGVGSGKNWCKEFCLDSDGTIDVDYRRDEGGILRNFADAVLDKSF